jgi:hypothetical protein
MIQRRELRFLIPPFVFAAFLIWGLVVDPNVLVLNLVKDLPLDRIVVSGTVAIIAIIAAGFLIAQLSLCLLHFLCPNYEKTLEETALKDVWNALDVSSNGAAGGCKSQCRWEAGIMYVHGLLKHKHVAPGIADWLERRWTHFLVSVNCCVALILALLSEFYLHCLLVTRYHKTDWVWVNDSGHCFLCDQCYLLWVVLTGATVLILCMNACAARRETERMITFASKCKMIERMQPWIGKRDSSGEETTGTEVPSSKNEGKGRNSERVFDKEGK